MIYRIEAVKETKDGYAVTVSFPVSHAVKKRRFTVSRASYEENGSPREGEEIGYELYASLVAECDARDALLHAYSLLDYADCSAAALYKKLRLRGYLKESALEALRVLTEKGVLSDLRLLSHAIPTLAEARLCGRRRLLELLLQKGFREKDIRAAISSCEENGTLDLEELKRRFVEKKQLDRLPEGECIAALKKQGF